jgi:two-component system, NarL family, nitrate/nitrite response regulator NarL
MTHDSVFLIDASRLFREGLRRIFSDSPFVVVYESACITEALPFVASLEPSLVLVDPPDDSAVLTERIRQIRAAAPGARIVVLTEAIQAKRLADALSAGVDGYLLKNMSAAALHHSLRLVLLGEKVFPTDLADLLTESWTVSRELGRKISAPNGLSTREMQILGYLLSGASNKLIAHELHITDGTVKVHLKAILKKIGVQNRTQAAIWALNHGVANTQARTHGTRSPPSQSSHDRPPLDRPPHDRLPTCRWRDTAKIAS